ncbi:MAG: hypothetical protein WBX25_36535 [Rhodomicrobium sp.]
MTTLKPVIGFFAAMLLCAAQAAAEDKEPSLTVEMGGAGEWRLRGGSSCGPDIGLEVTVIERWLEIEASVTPLFSRAEAEIGTGLIFRKPFDLSKSLEFLIGAGPEWIFRPAGEKPSSIAAEATVEFVYSPWPERHVGFFIEPAYTYDFGKGHEQAISVTGGLHIGID